MNTKKNLFCFLIVLLAVGDININEKRYLALAFKYINGHAYCLSLDISHQSL